jgi:HAMP domain-containing protein
MTLQLRTVLMVTSLLVLAVLATATSLAWSERRSLLAQGEYDGRVIAGLLAQSSEFARQVPADVETTIGEQMVVQATLAAHLVAMAEAAGLPPDQINAHLRQITGQTALSEVWITDPKGHAYLRNRSNIDFTFDPDPRRQPQAHAFWPLLTGKKRVVIQEARKREVDSQVYKYVGVAGVDKPRIVQVGYHASLLERLRRQIGLTRLVSELVNGGNITGIRVVDYHFDTLAQGVAAGHTARPGLSRAEIRDLQAVVRGGRAISRLERDNLEVVTPMTDTHGRRIATALVSLPIAHVRAEMSRKLQLAVVVAVIVLGVGVLASVVLARRVTGPVARLTAASAAVQAEAFQPETLAEVASRDDELGCLARVFLHMAREVQAREQRLKQQVQQLRIEVDVARRERQVAEITGTDYFQELQQRAGDLRRRAAVAGNPRG